MLKYIVFFLLCLCTFSLKSQHSIQGFAVTQNANTYNLYDFDINYVCNLACSPSTITFVYDNTKLKIQLPDANGVLQDAPSPAVLPISCNTLGGTSNTWLRFTGKLKPGEICDGEQIQITAILHGTNCTDDAKSLTITASVEDKWILGSEIDYNYSRICHDGEIYYKVTPYETELDRMKIGINIQQAVFSMDVPVCAEVSIFPMFGTINPVVSFTPINATFRRMTWAFPPQYPYLATHYPENSPYTWTIKMHYDCVRCLNEVSAYNPNLAMTGIFNCSTLGPTTHTNRLASVSNIPTISPSNVCPKDCEIDIPKRFDTELRKLNHFCPDNCLGTTYSFSYDNKTLGASSSSTGDVGRNYKDFAITYEVPDGVVLDGASWNPNWGSQVRVLVELNQQPGTWVNVPFLPNLGYFLCNYYLNGNKINRIRFESIATLDANGNIIQGFPVGTVISGALSLKLNSNLVRSVTNYRDSTCTNIQRQFPWTRTIANDPLSVKIINNPNPTLVNPTLPLPVSLSPTDPIIGLFTLDATIQDSCVEEMPIGRCCESTDDTIYAETCRPSANIAKAVFDPAITYTTAGGAYQNTLTYANIGDIRRYRLYIYNEADGAINNFRLEDIIDPRLTYIPNTLSWAAVSVAQNGSNYPPFNTLTPLSIPANGQVQLTTFNNHICNLLITEPTASNNQTFSVRGLDLPPSCTSDHLNSNCELEKGQYQMILLEFSVRVNASTAANPVLPGMLIPNSGQLKDLPSNNNRGISPISNLAHIVIPTPPTGLRIDANMEGTCEGTSMGTNVNVRAGDNVDFSMTVTNSGSYPITNLQLYNLRPVNISGASILNAPASIRPRADFEVNYICGSAPTHSYIGLTPPNPSFAYSELGNNTLCNGNCASNFQYQCVAGNTGIWGTCNTNSAWLSANYANGFVLNPGESVTILFKGQVAANATIGGENYTSFFVTGEANGKNFCFESNLLKISVTQDGCGRTPPPATSCCKIPLTIEEKVLQNGKLSDEGGAYGYSIDVPISAGSSQITEIRASVVGFEMEYENEDCARCFTPYNLIGTLVEKQPISFKKMTLSKGLTLKKVNTASLIAPNANRELIWSAPAGQPITLNTQLPLMLYIPKPRSLDCCAANVKVCIKFVVKDIDCNFCEKTACFELKIPGK